ncbi:radical SAM enzyme [Aspergillus homomorphus CBS 101889]|uniref:Radical SAM enzyme n=1 Tax=Aspergillus homomorphus (strain CBS 101889) TaxID=1450537 RepID=A0A395ICM8_ASPHC|nr:radical SAM enzyme [Aspergillus homomorphus CBS 101889]RAL17791.1 radical SAM enzyme [Aspergillus homomorphus CBS 101889]
MRANKCPISVKYHFTRRCNKACGFCFHTESSSHIELMTNIKRRLALLQAAGMRKINFAGGEPFLYPVQLGQMVDYCKEVLSLESVSIVTNGSKVTRRFLARHGRNIDILAVSCDSFNESIDIAIGRGSGNQVTKLYEIRDLCREYGIKFKINTVVCRLNFQEDMNQQVAELQPFRWKWFQVLLVDGENESEQRLRDARKFLIRDEEFAQFCDVHRHGRAPSSSILEVVQKALECVYWDEKSFISKGGLYDWSRDQKSCSEPHKDLQW